MKTTLVILLLSCLAASVTGAPAESRTERDMEATPSHAALTAADLHPHTPILLADLDESIPALVVIRERAMTLAELEQAIQAEERERDVDREHTQAMETEADEDEDDETSADEDDDDSALIESDFEISAPYGGYGGYGKKGGYGYGGLGYGGYGGFGKKGGYGFGYGSKKIPYKKVPYKKVPLKKVPFKKGPPKKKAPPKKKGGYGGFGFGLKKGGFGYGGGFGGHH